MLESQHAPEQHHNHADGGAPGRSLGQGPGRRHRLPRTLYGEQVTVSRFSVRLLEDAAPGTDLLAFYEDGQALLNVGYWRRLTRLAPVKEAKPGSKVEFLFQDQEGKTGRFKIWADYIFSGQIAEGSWSEQAARIKEVVIKCPPPPAPIPPLIKG